MYRKTNLSLVFSLNIYYYYFLNVWDVKEGSPFQCCMEAKFSNNFFSVVKLLCCHALPLSPSPLKYSQFGGFSKLVIFTYKFTLSIFCNWKHFGCFESCECGLMVRFLGQPAVGGLGTWEPLPAAVDSLRPRLLSTNGPRLSLLLF